MEVGATPRATTGTWPGSVSSSAQYSPRTCARVDSGQCALRSGGSRATPMRSASSSRTGRPSIVLLRSTAKEKASSGRGPSSASTTLSPGSDVVTMSPTRASRGRPDEPPAYGSRPPAPSIPNVDHSSAPPTGHSDNQSVVTFAASAPTLSPRSRSRLSWVPGSAGSS